VAEDAFALVFDANGIMVRIATAPGFRPAPSTVLGWQVTDISSAVAELEERGVAFQRYPGMKQDKQGIWVSPANAKIAWFKDPDGNVLSLAEFA
jgi:hypothetical protein